MRHITTQQIELEYGALVEIERVIREAGSMDADQVYSHYEKKFSRHSFDRIIRVLELSKQVSQNGKILIWNRRRS